MSIYRLVEVLLNRIIKRGATEMRLLIIVGSIAGILLAIPFIVTAFTGDDVVTGMKPGSDTGAHDTMSPVKATPPDWRAVLTILPDEAGDGASYYFQAETEAQRLIHSSRDPGISQLRQQLSGLSPFIADPGQDPQAYEWNLGNMVAANTALMGSKKQTCSFTQASSFNSGELQTIFFRGVTRGLCYLGDFYVYTDPSSALAYYEAALIHAGRNLDDAAIVQKPTVALIASVKATQMALKRLEKFYTYCKQNGNVANVKRVSRDLLVFYNYYRLVIDDMPKP
jgi:hypothetical protein